MFSWWGINSVMHSDPCVNIASWDSFVTGRFKKELWNSLFFNITWSTWFKRNNAKFQKKTLNITELIYAIKVRLGHWVYYYARHFPYSANQVTENLRAVWD